MRLSICCLMFITILCGGENWNFDGNLDSASGRAQLRITGGTGEYTADRFGNPGKALYLTEGQRLIFGDFSFSDGQKDRPFCLAWYQKCEVPEDKSGRPESKILTMFSKKGEYRIGWSAAFRGTLYSGDKIKSSHCPQMRMNSGKWTHIAVNFDGNDFTFFQDGKLLGGVAGENNSPEYRAMVPDKNPLVFGGNFKGAIDDLQILDRVLTQEEIRRLVSPSVTVAKRTDTTAWKYRFSSFVDTKNPENKLKLETVAGLSFDDEAIYAAVHCQLPEGYISKSRESGQIWLDDSVELFLFPIPGESHYYQFVVNSAGAVLSAMDGDSRWESGFTAVVNQTGNAWTVEMRIPFDKMRLDHRVGSDWGINIIRNTPGANEHAMLAWTPDYRDAKKAAVARFETAPQLWRFQRPFLLAQLREFKERVSEELLVSVESMEKRLQSASALPEEFGREFTELKEKYVKHELNAYAIYSGRLRINAGHTLQKIPREAGSYFQAQAIPVTLTAAAGEAESFQLTVESTDQNPLLKLVAAPGKLWGEKISLEWTAHLVEHVKTMSAPRYPTSHVGYWADPLLPLGEFDVSPGLRRTLWFTVEVPPGTPAGNYSGEIVISGDGENVSIPVKLRVRPFELPHTLKTAFGNYRQAHQRYCGKELPFDKFVESCRFLKRYRLDSKNAFQESVIWKKDQPDLTEAAKLFTELKPFYSALYRLPSARVLQKQWQPENWLARYRSTVEKWPQNETYVYGVDELKERDCPPEKCDEVMAIYRRFKEIAPWPIVQTIDHNGADFLPKMVGSVDIWCPLLRLYDRESDFFQERKREGEILWLYTCIADFYPLPTFYLDSPATDPRVIFHLTFKAGATGFLYWTVNWWHYYLNPDWPENPEFKKQKNTHGDGMLVYPGPDFSLYPSIRLEAIRDGIEDYEYLALLKSLMASLPNEKTLIAEAEILLSSAEVCRSMTDFTTSPEVILGYRQKVGDMIEKLLAKKNGR